MKNSIYSIALAALFIFGCNQSPNESDPMQVNDPNHPNSAKSGGTSDACFDIPTPINVTAELGDENTDGPNVQICWGYITSPDSYYLTDTYTAQGRTTPRPNGVVPTSTLNPTYVYQFWGGSQQSIVQSPSYSGHYDVFRSEDGGATWTKIGETRDNCYTDMGPTGTGIGDGDYMYAVKAKSLEGSSPNQCTHHSLLSEGVEITVDFCTEDAISDTLTVSGIYGDNVDWSGSDFTIGNGGQINPHWTMLVTNRTQNSCTGDITSTPTETPFVGALCVRLGGGPNNIDPATAAELTAHWQTNKYHIDGAMDNPGATGTYTLYYLTDIDDDGDCTYPDDVIATSTVTVN
jgi:hypothetical protein